MNSKFYPDKLDSDTHILYLKVPGSKVVYLQGIFEIYEGVGTVRTLDIKKSLVSVLTTTDMLSECFNILESIKDEVGWVSIAKPEGVNIERFLGYFKNKE